MTNNELEISINEARIDILRKHRQLLNVENEVLRQRIRSNTRQKRRYKDTMRQLQKRIAQLKVNCASLFDTEDKADAKA